MENFIKGTTIDYVFDFQDMDYVDMDSIKAEFILNGSPVGVFTIANGFIVAGATATEAALTIPGAITAGWDCGNFYILLSYEYNGEPVKIEQIEGGTTQNGY